MMPKILLSSVVFLLCIWFGITLAQHNPIENDESYSQHESIQNLSYVDILLGRVNEGNNSPLFYLMQKGFGQATHFRLDTVWTMEQYVCEQRAQLWMRFLPILFMSLGLSVCFYFFYVRYNLMTALIVLSFFLTTPSIWIYWAQNRPYSLWISLTCIQTLLLTEFFVFKNSSPRLKQYMIITHGLLCVSTSFGIIQTLLALLFIRRKWTWPLVIPIILGVFYAFTSPKYPFRVPAEWMGLIYANISIERLVFLGITAFCLRKFLALTLWQLILISFSLLFICCIYWQQPTGTQGFELSSRYLLFLLPSSIIIMTVYWQELFSLHGNFLSRMALIQVLILLFILGIWRTFIVLERLL